MYHSGTAPHAIAYASATRFKKSLQQTVCIKLVDLNLRPPLASCLYKHSDLIPLSCEDLGHLNHLSTLVMAKEVLSFNNI